MRSGVQAGTGPRRRMCAHNTGRKGWQKVWPKTNLIRKLKLWKLQTKKEFGSKSSETKFRKQIGTSTPKLWLLCWKRQLKLCNKVRRKDGMEKSAFMSLIYIGCSAYVFHIQLNSPEDICTRNIEILLREKNESYTFLRIVDHCPTYKGSGGF